MYNFITEKFGSSSMIKVRVRVRFDEIEKFEVRSFTRWDLPLINMTLRPGMDY